jgi:hypothetical protein
MNDGGSVAEIQTFKSLQLLISQPRAERVEKFVYSH